jgi:hypothetical protein
MMIAMQQEARVGCSVKSTIAACKSCGTIRERTAVLQARIQREAFAGGSVTILRYYLRLCAPVQPKHWHVEAQPRSGSQHSQAQSGGFDDGMLQPLQPAEAPFAGQMACQVSETADNKPAAG